MLVHSRASKRPHPCRAGSQTRQRRWNRLDDPDGAAGDRQGTTARHGTSTARRDGGGEDGGGQGEDIDGGGDGENGTCRWVKVTKPTLEPATSPTPGIEYVTSAPGIAHTAHSPVIEYVALLPDVTDATPAPVCGDVAPAPSVTFNPVIVAPAPVAAHAAPSPVTEHVAPASAVTPVSPAPVCGDVARAPTVTVIEYVAPAHAAPHTQRLHQRPNTCLQRQPSPLRHLPQTSPAAACAESRVEEVAPAHADSHAAPMPVIEHVTPAPDVGYTVPAPVTDSKCTSDAVPTSREEKWRPQRTRCRPSSAVRRPHLRHQPALTSATSPAAAYAEPASGIEHVSPALAGTCAATVSNRGDEAIEDNDESDRGYDSNRR